MSAIEDHLSELLDAKNAELASLKDKLVELEHQLEQDHRWSLPRNIENTPGLPVPRLEFKWTPHPEQGWKSYTVEYYLVKRHLMGELTAIPLGQTKCSGGPGRDPRKTSCAGGRPELPFRDGAHACFDAGHLGLPVYLLTEDGPKPLDTVDYGPHQTSEGRKARVGAPTDT